MGRAVSDGWQPNERIVPSPLATLPSMQISPSRQGLTPSGLKYTIYPDGSGGVEQAGGELLNGWSIDCGKDAMNDRRDCKLTSHNARIFISYDFGSAPRWICVLGHDFPGRTAQLRVDSNPAVTTDDEGCVGAGFLPQMLKGTSITTRIVKWPYDYSNDQSGPLRGLPETIELVKFIRANVSKLSFAP